MSDLLAAALGYAERGWHVFPLRPNDKRPAIRDWQDRATTDPARITRCWSAGHYNIGIACGPSALVVIDLDTPKPGQTPPPGYEPCADGVAVFADLCRRHRQQIEPTYTVTTGRGGTHLYYRHPATGPELRNSAGLLGWLIDTRAHGGYVVAAASTVNGQPYTVDLDTDPAPLPGWLAERLTPPPPPPAQPVAVDLGHGRRRAYLDAAIRRQVAHLATATKGTRNRALYIAATALGQLAAGGAISDADVTAVLTPVATRIGLHPREITATIRSGLRAGARRPRSVTA